MLKRRILPVTAIIILLLLAVGHLFSPESVNPAQASSTQQAFTSATTVIFTDGDFASGWTDVSGVTDDPVVPGTGPGTSSFNGSSVQASGGNPGAYRKTTHTITYGDRIYSGGLNTSAVYTPATSGAISAIDFASDLQDPDFGTSGWVLILEQNGTLYFAVRGLGFSSSAWESFTLKSLTEQDFDTTPPGLDPNNEHPDFSAGGGPIIFGYVMTNSLPGPGTKIVNHGIDNWSITINPNRIYLPVIVR